MSRKNREIQVFSISFLDVLSCALGAIIILFVIIPKGDVEQMLQRNLMEVRAELVALQSEVRPSVTELDSILQALERETLARQNAEREMEQLATENEELKDRARGAGGPGGAMYGFSAELGFVINWPENLDVDLWVKDVRTGKWGSYAARNPGFAKYFQDIQSRQQGDDRFELVYQQKVRPGNYDVWIHLYSSSGAASVTGFAILFPFTQNEQTIHFNKYRITHTAPPHQGGGKYVGRVRVNGNQMTFSPNS
mgnify:FL=1